MDAIRERAASQLAELEASIENINRQLRMAAEGFVSLPAIVVSEPVISDESTRQALSLISSAWSWTKATRALIARKAYEVAAA
jgi:dsDNA-specific endonuclease/ATPase MutS2